MRVYLVVLLTAAGNVELVQAMTCYMGASPNRPIPTDCGSYMKYCFKIQIYQLFTDEHITQWSCGPECPQSVEGPDKPKESIMCCQSDLCNGNSGDSSRISFTMMAVGIAASFIFAFLWPGM